MTVGDRVRPGIARLVGRSGALLVAFGLAACGPTHLERAKDHHAEGLAALRRADAPGARGHFEAVVRESSESLEAREETVPRQARLLEGSARLRLDDLPNARAALGLAHDLGADPDHPWVARVLAADACELLRAADVAHAEALCWAHVLDTTPPGEADLRIRAATEYGNALARRLPHTGTLLSFRDPAFQRFVAVALAQPADVEVLFLLARRLPLFCGEADFKAHLAGYAELQTDLLRAALHLGWFRTARARVEAEAYLKELAQRPLCGGT